MRITAFTIIFHIKDNKGLIYDTDKTLHNLSPYAFYYLFCFLTFLLLNFYKDNDFCLLTAVFLVSKREMVQVRNNVYL